MILRITFGIETKRSFY